MRSFKVIILFLALCLYAASAEAQKRGGPRKHATASAKACKVSAVPKGFVVVGYSLGVCPTPITKRADNGDIVCGTPSAKVDKQLPAGFSILSQVQGIMVPAGCSSAFVIWDSQSASDRATPAALESACDAAEKRSMDRLTAREKSTGYLVSDLEVQLVITETFLCKERAKGAH